MTPATWFPLAGLRDLGFPVPDCALVGCTAIDEELYRAVVTVLTRAGVADGRAGDRPVVRAIPVGGAQVPTVFLSVSAEFLAWLGDDVPGDAATDGQAGGDLAGDIVRIARRLGTRSVAVVPVVLGCRRPGDGWGVARSRDVASGQAGVSGSYWPTLAGGKGEGPRQLTASTTESWWPPLVASVRTAEDHYRDAVEIRFTIQDGQLLILAARPAPRDAPGECAVAVALAAEGKLSPVDALDRVTPACFAAATRMPPPAVAPGTAIGRGLGVSPGAASGIATFEVARALERASRGEAVVLLRPETRPEDLQALLAATAVVTTRGGRTSHAAVVARAIGRPCVAGLADAAIDATRGVLDVASVRIMDGDLITVDGTHGLLGRGDAPRGTAAPTPGPATERLLAMADERRRLAVLANADTPADAARARRLGGAGIGLCRTEHMFLGDRQPLLTEMLLGPYDSSAREALAELHQLQRADFTALLAEMDGLPVTVRLLDPPRHEFLPDRTEMSVEVALAVERGRPDPAAERQLLRVARNTEQNPMLGIRGIRLGVLLPWLYEMQISALAEATAARLQAGGDPRPRLMIPMVAAAAELTPVLAYTEHVLSELRALAGPGLALPVGVMIETPRAALTAGELAGVIDFFSFGTNDLTQMTWGLSRDDTDVPVLVPYQELGFIDASPFERIDLAGVGELIRMAVRAGRRVKPGMLMGVCGEHAADPDSILAFHDWDLDYVSCSVPDLAVARYAAGYAARWSASTGEESWAVETS
jgi:pyruvate, orthophosphate dikinase